MQMFRDAKLNNRVMYKHEGFFVLVTKTTRAEKIAAYFRLFQNYANFIVKLRLNIVLEKVGISNAD